MPAAEAPAPLAWFLFAAPAVLGAVTALLLIGSVFGWNPLWTTEGVTLSELVAVRDIVGIRNMIANGADPTAKYVVREELVKSNAVELTPLEAAITTRERFVVEELLRHVPALDDAERRRLVCFARSSDAPQLADMLIGELPLPVDCSGVAVPW
jgi:hypothetical protein